MEQCRRQFENVFRFLKWRAARAFDRQPTIKPIVWREKRNVEVPKALESEKRVDEIRKEIEIYSALSDYYPNKPLNEDAWRILINCESLKQRIDHVKFLRLNEIKAEKDKERKEMARGERRKERESSGPDSPSFSQSLVSIREHDRREQYERVVRTLRTERRIEPVPRLAIDCRFLPLLSPRGANLTARQIQFLISENRDRSTPWPMTLSRFDESTEDMRRLKRKNLPTLDASSVDAIPDVSKKNLRDLFPASSCVYLSPDGEEELEEIEEDKVYIIGGIVDRVTERGIPRNASREAADEEGIKSVRLPIDRYVKWQSGSRFLTLNAVIGILQDVYDRGGRGEEAWIEAMKRNIPARNVRGSEEKNEMGRIHHARIREYDRQIREIIQKEVNRLL